MALESNRKGYNVWKLKLGKFMFENKHKHLIAR